MTPDNLIASLTARPRKFDADGTTWTVRGEFEEMISITAADDRPWHLLATPNSNGDGVTYVEVTWGEGEHDNITVTQFTDAKTVTEYLKDAARMVECAVEELRGPSNAPLTDAENDAWLDVCFALTPRDIRRLTVEFTTPNAGRYRTVAEAPEAY